MQRRILFLEQFGEMGGGQTVLMSLVHAAQAIGASVTILAPGGGTLERTIGEQFAGSVAFVSCPEPRLAHGRKGLADIVRLAAYGWRFRRYLNLLRQQDVIYLNGPRHLPHMLIYALLTRARQICHVHLDHSGTEKRLLRLAARWPARFHLVANSGFVINALRAPAGQVTLLENALGRDFGALAFDDRFTDASPSWTAAVIGTVRPEKGQDIAIAACGARTDIVLRILGRDADDAAEWIATLRASPGNILFDGPTSDVAEAIKNLGIQFSLVPSRRDESFGLVAIESMASSCITIVSGRGGLAEIAQQTGALVAADAPALAETLNRLLSLPAPELRGTQAI